MAAAKMGLLPSGGIAGSFAVLTYTRSTLRGLSRPRLARGTKFAILVGNAIKPVPLTDQFGTTSELFTEYRLQAGTAMDLLLRIAITVVGALIVALIAYSFRRNTIGSELKPAQEFPFTCAKHPLPSFLGLLRVIYSHKILRRHLSLSARTPFVQLPTCGLQARRDLGRGTSIYGAIPLRHEPAGPRVLPHQFRRIAPLLRGVADHFQMSRPQDGRPLAGPVSERLQFLVPRLLCVAERVRIFRLGLGVVAALLIRPIQRLLGSRLLMGGCFLLLAP